MSAVVFRYSCASCGHTFEASGILDFSYGEFVMRSKEGSEAYLEAITNEVFKEVSEIVEAHPCLVGADERQSGGVIQKIFGVACDPSPSGNQFHIGMNPVCPSCSSLEMKSWQELYPHMPSSIPSVTHNRWAAMGECKKIEIIDRVIRELLLL